MEPDANGTEVLGRADAIALLETRILLTMVTGRRLEPPRPDRVRAPT